jgi:hypothetical protein
MAAWLVVDAECNGGVAMSTEAERGGGSPPPSGSRRPAPLIHVYETVVLNGEGDLAAQIRVLPLSSVDTALARRVRSGSINAVDWHTLWDQLDFEPEGEVQPNRVTAAISGLFRFAPFETSPFEEPAPGPPVGWDDTEKAVQSFARRLARAKVVPVEQSPLVPESLTSLVAKGTSGMGQATAWFGLWVGEPALVIGGLFGIVVVKGVEAYAEGASKAFERAGEQHFVKLLRLPDSKRGHDVLNPSQQDRGLSSPRSKH